MRPKSYDKLFFSIVLILVLSGLFIFSSAALGIFADGVNNYIFIVLKQVVIGLLFGAGALYLVSGIYYKHWQKWSVYLFIFSILSTLLVFIPQIGISTLGARRWIDLGFVSIQPSEFLKFGFVVYFASWLASKNDRVSNLKDGFLPAMFILAIPSIILLNQPDTGTLLCILLAGISMFFVAGGKAKHLLLLLLVIALGIGYIIYTKPYAMARITTFLDPQSDPLGAGYQIRQALIAIGSGQILGRGFGQSIQKFNFLPEPLGDAIFAVSAEEFGFVGSTTIIFLFLGFTLRGLRLSSRSPDQFSRLLALGIVILISSQSFINIGAMLGVLPLTGVPLLFISHGGTALLFALAEVGLLLNISKFSNLKKT
ncbi:MAG: cell division protein FtsW [Candidatus Vogelbacteria bacterium]|nr:cell division protein FtsW [Candidatus Vogelbacteria bacterium]